MKIIIGIWLLILLVAAISLAILVRQLKRKRQAVSDLPKNLNSERTESQSDNEDLSTDEQAVITTDPAPLPISQEILAHYRQFFACQPEIHHPDMFGVAIAIYPPTRKRGWWTYATAGLHKELQTELLLYSYKREETMLHHLAHTVKQLRAMPAATRQGVDEGDVFSLQSAVLDGSMLTCLLATSSFFEEPGFEYYTNGEDVVRMLMLHPIAEAEKRYMQEHGLSALEALFVEQQVNSLDLYRLPVTGEGGKGIEPDTHESQRSGGAQRANSVD